DQNDWEDKKFPNKKLLDALFPDTPVALTRIDGHAMLCNQAALDLANITKETKMDGGEIIIEDGELSGVLIDNPMELVEAIFPKPNRELQINALLDAQNICTNLGLTTVSDAGLHREVIELMDSLQQTGDLHMRVYAMVSNTKDNLDYYLTKGKIKTDQLNVQSVKVYADGALGSRGAALKAPYSDKDHHFGAMVIGLEDFKALASRIEAANYQMNTHAIGDSANRFVLKTYEKTLQGETDRRWRVEHAQIITDNDFELFKNENIIPSIQPTHATSDMYWAEDRLGAERIKGAYAYKTLLNASGKVALGTDFPVEQVSPFLTFYAAVSRQDVKGYPEGGFNLQDGLSREETLKGMTIWAAYANFEEDEKGSIEVGKFADFIILDQDIMTTDVKNIPNIKVEQTYIGGVKQ
uniref:amidohydrolase n=1 Tax=Xanthomarina gelatinilytica TaxID=1137281 RepID=UPI003518E079